MTTSVPATPGVDPLTVPLASEVHCPADDRWSGTLSYTPDGMVALFDRQGHVLLHVPLAQIGPTAKVDTVLSISIEGTPVAFVFGNRKEYARVIRWDFSGPTNTGWTHHRAKSRWNAYSGLDDWAALLTAAGLLTVNQVPLDGWSKVGKPLAIALVAMITLSTLGALAVGLLGKALTN